MDIKIPTFVVRYANYKIDIISSNNLMKENIKNYGLRRIDKAVNACRRGLITVDECMLIIVRPFEGCENL